jgi:MYXO-CTERM domain-containing protein
VTDAYTTDQRGYARPGTRNDQVNKKCEVGAWEAQASDPTAIVLRGLTATPAAAGPVGLAAVLALGLGGLAFWRRR